MRAPRTPGWREQLLDQLVDRRHRDLVVGGQAAVALGHDGAEPAQVAPGEQPLGLVHPGALGDDVAGPPAQDGVGQLAEVAERTGAERPPEDVGGPLALGAPGGVGRGRSRGAGSRCARSRRPPRRGRAPAGSRGWRSRCGARARPWRRRWPADRAGPRATPRRARPPGSRGPARAGRGRGRARAGARPRRRRSRTGRPHREGAGHPDAAARAAAAGAAGGRPPGAASAGTGAVSPSAISRGWSGELVRVDPDEEAARLRA